MNCNDRVAEFVQDMTWEALPADVQQRARLCLLDGLGATLADTLAPISRIAGEYAVESLRGDAATIFQHAVERGLHGRPRTGHRRRRHLHPRPPRRTAHPGNPGRSRSDGRQRQSSP